MDPKDINSVCDSERLLLGLEMNREIKELAGSQKHLTGNEVYSPPWPPILLLAHSPYPPDC